jgi:riboflavin kinase/FMN adenylyltransferase
MPRPGNGVPGKFSRRRDASDRRATPHAVCKMDIIDDLTKARLRQEAVLTIGTFDGVHRGHQALIGALVERARSTSRLAALITFHPHPAAVLAPERVPRYLTTPGEKMALLERLGVDLVVLLSFDQKLAATSAREFMERVSTQLRLRELWVGADFALGRNREGNVPGLQELGHEFGYRVQVFEPVQSGSEIISSSRIRSLLEQGRVDEAAGLLGRYPSLSGEVVRGARRGHRLGFPTANLEVRPERAVPADGIYAVFAVLGAERYPAVANVGVRPTFDNGQRIVEAHIFDFDQDIYGCDLVVEFVAWLRDERRFEHVNDLMAQMGQDSLHARRILTQAHQDMDTRAHMASSPDTVLETCPYRYHEVEHTADRALQVWGRALPDLFVGAARGMYSLMVDLDGPVAANWQQLRLEAWDREALLVDWLNELLFLTETQGLAFVDCRIEFLGDSTESVGSSPESLVQALSENPNTVALVAQVGSAKAPVTKAQIKAATFHDLALVEDETGWSAVITFDV